MAQLQSPTFGDLVRKHRLALGLTQEELAERAQLSARGISDLERGVTTHPRKDTLQLLIDALQLSGEERAALLAAARLIRMVPGNAGSPWNGPGNDRDHVSLAGATAEISAARAGERVSNPSHAASAPRWRRPPHLPVHRERQLPSRVVTAAIAVLVLLVAASAGLVGQRLLRSAGAARAHPVARGSFLPWGLARPSGAESIVHLANAFRVAVDRRGNIYVAEGNGSYADVIPKDHVDILKLSPSGRILAHWGHFGTRPGELNQPAGLAVDQYGNVYVVDYGNDRVQKFSPAGKVLSVWGSFGTRPGYFDLPVGIALDSRGNIYVTDYGNNRVQKLSPSGKPLAVWGNECGTNPGQFCNPTDVAVSPSGRVHVVDYGNYRIQTFSSTGKFLNSWRPSSNPAAYDGPNALAIDTQGDIYLTYHYSSVVFKFTSSGIFRGVWNVGPSDLGEAMSGLAVDRTGHTFVVSRSRLFRRSSDGLSFQPVAIVAPPLPARFDRPSLLAVDRGHNVYVLTGSSENHLLKISPSGHIVRDWGVATFDPGGGHGAYDLTGLAVDGRGYIYASEALSGQILKLSPAGRILQRWGSEGSGPGQFETPYGLAVDDQGNIYVADTGNGRIQKLSPTGRPLGQWGSFGTRPGQFIIPRAVTVDAQGNMYVADTANARIQKLSAAGKVLAVWLNTSPVGKDFSDLISVVVDRRGNLYAVDSGDNAVTELSPAGKAMARWGSRGAGPGQFRGPQGVVVDSNGNLYVADTGNNRVQKLSRPR